MLLPEKMTQLAIHLAEGGKAQDALALTRKLLDRFTREVEQSDAHAMWRYDRIVEQLTPTLATYGGLPALTLLSEELLASLGQTAHVDNAELDDSYIWRPAIEEHAQNAPKGFRASRNALVSAIRDVAERLIRDSVTTLPQMVAILEQFQAPIFSRLVMHLLRLFPDQARGIVARYLTTHEFFDGLCYRHEYALLSGVGFRILTPQEQQTVLGWIARTPDWARATASGDRAAAEGAEGAEHQVDDNLDFWRLERLSPFAQDLPSQWKARYDSLVQQYGVPEHPDFGVYLTAGWVDEAPGAITVEQLRGMRMPQLVEYLKTWTPSDSWRGPSREGVGQLLVELISTEPLPFARDAERFADLHPTYLAALFQGFERALARHLAFPWDAILRLAQRCLGQEALMTEAQLSVRQSAEGSVTVANGTGAGDDATDQREAQVPSDTAGSASNPIHSDASEPLSFAWVRSTIAHLVECALMSHPVPIAPELQDLVWILLRPLTSDSDPSPEDERRFGGDNMDPASLAINSVRGVALHATILYALWLRTIEETAAQQGSATSDGRAVTWAEEVATVLDAHLNVTLDPSLAVRSVYGQRFPLLAVLDPRWAAEHVAAIFPPDEEQRRYWEAAWEAYVLYNQPNRRTWALLRDEYGRALDRLGVPGAGRKHAAEAGARTIEHLIQLAWAGEIPIGGPGTMLDQAFDRASDQLLGEVTSHVGLRVVNTEGDLEEAIRQRLQDLWEWRMSSRLVRDAPAHQQELAGFGWWYGSGRFDASWSLAQLRKILTLTGGRIEGTHLVIERLAEAPDESLDEALGCLIQLVSASGFDNYVDALEPQIGNVLTAVRERGGTETRAQVTQLINQLVARGYVSFRTYLPSPTQPPDSGITE